MRSESAYLRRFKNPYRPAYEILASGLWATMLIYVLWLGFEGIMPQSYIVVLLTVILGMSVFRLAEGWIILRHPESALRIPSRFHELSGAQKQNHFRRVVDRFRFLMDVRTFSEAL